MCVSLQVDHNSTHLAFLGLSDEFYCGGSVFFIDLQIKKEPRRETRLCFYDRKWSKVYALLPFFQPRVPR